MKFSPAKALMASLMLTATFQTSATITGTVKAWPYMQSAGWKSADGYDFDKMHNALYQAEIIDNYPWTKQFLLRVRGGGSFYLADKASKTVRHLKIKSESGYSSDLTSVYQGDDNGKGCFFAVIDGKALALNKAEDDITASFPPRPNAAQELAQVREQFKPEVVAVFPDNCVNKQQEAAMKAKRSSDERALQQWVAKESLKELCRRTGNC